MAKKADRFFGTVGGYVRWMIVEIIRLCQEVWIQYMPQWLCNRLALEGCQTERHRLPPTLTVPRILNR